MNRPVVKSDVQSDAKSDTKSDASTRRFWRDLSPPSVVAGFVAVLVGYASSVPIVFQAALALGADAGQIASWMLVLGVGNAIGTIALSLRYRMPVLTAWSTPGAALLLGSAAGMPLDVATGAFCVSAVLMAIAGYSGLFERSLSRIAAPIAAALLAGILLRFGLQAFTSIASAPALVLAMCAAWLIGRRLLPRYAVLAALLAGLAMAAAQHRLPLESLRWQLAMPVFVAPRFDLAAILGVGLPLFVVTMVSQNVAGAATLKAHRFSPPLSPIVGLTGVLTLLLAPFGAFALNLAAITAAICMGREAGDDPRRRYTAAVAAGVFYLLAGLCGAVIGALLSALPMELVAAIAGIALFGTIASGLHSATANETLREPAIITFLVTASGLTLWGIGSAFWGLIAGALTHWVLRRS